MVNVSQVDLDSAIVLNDLKFVTSHRKEFQMWLGNQENLEFLVTDACFSFVDLAQVVMGGKIRVPVELYKRLQIRKDRINYLVVNNDILEVIQ